MSRIFHPLVVLSASVVSAAGLALLIRFRPHATDPFVRKGYYSFLEHGEL